MTKLSQKVKDKTPVFAPMFAVGIIKSMIFDCNREHYVALTLNSRNVPLSVHVISIGTVNCCIVHPREAFVAAIEERAEAIIFAYNHPSGVLEPTQEDIEVKERMIKVGEILGIQVIENLIIDKEGKFKCI